MKEKWLIFCFAWLFAACGMTTEVGHDEDFQTSNMSLVVTASASSDVTHIHFKVSECGGDVVAENLSRLSPLTSNDLLWDDIILDETSSHSFSSFKIRLTEGCYDVQARPVRANGEASSICQEALVGDVLVANNSASEVLLVLVCAIEAQGSIDVKALFNYPPVVAQISYEPSMFLACGETAQVCVSALDMDNDLMEIVWSQVSGKNAPFQVTYSGQMFSLLTECIEVELSSEGVYVFSATVYDLFDGGRIETWIQNNHDPTETSHHRYEFELVVSCSLSHECTRSADFWRTYSAHAQDEENQFPWPLDEDTLMCGMTWWNILNTAPQGINVWFELAHQYIAAFLNLETVINAPSEVIDAIILADDLLASSCTSLLPNATTFTQAHYLRNLLLEFNTSHEELCQ